MTHLCATLLLSSSRSWDSEHVIVEITRSDICKYIMKLKRNKNIHARPTKCTTAMREERRGISKHTVKSGEDVASEIIIPQS